MRRGETMYIILPHSVYLDVSFDFQLVVGLHIDIDIYVFQTCRH